jgi:hypothetical protein
VPAGRQDIFFYPALVGAWRTVSEQRGLPSAVHFEVALALADTALYLHDRKRQDRQ